MAEIQDWDYDENECSIIMDTIGDIFMNEVIDFILINCKVSWVFFPGDILSKSVKISFV